MFCSLEKQRQSNQTIKQLKQENGTVTEKPDEILNTMRKFYKELYKAEKLYETRQEEILTQTYTPKLTEKMRTTCDEDYRADELTEALTRMKNVKSPGTDGLTPEFYKTFWHILANDFTEMTNEVLRRKRLTKTQRQALLISISKKGDRTDLSNWRPIFLLNTDYKIITKAMTNRIKVTLNHTISKYQTACVPNRNMHMNLFYTRDVIKIAKTENFTETCIVSINQIKAFDRVDWNYLHKTIKSITTETKWRTT